MTIDISRRKGRFCIPRPFIVESPDDIRLLMYHMVIVRAESKFDIDSIEYSALSILFNEVGEHQPIKNYEFEVHDDTMRLGKFYIPRTSAYNSFGHVNKLSRADDRRTTIILEHKNTDTDMQSTVETWLDVEIPNDIPLFIILDRLKDVLLAEFLTHSIHRDIHTGQSMKEPINSRKLLLDD